MHFSRFGPEANLFEELETLFRVYGESGTGKVRNYLHDEEEAAPYNQEPGTFTPWEEIPPDTDMLFYEGLHGAIVTETVNVAQHGDLHYRCHPRRRPQINTEAPPRQVGTRLHARGNRRHDPTSHARLCELHLSPILADARQFPACPDRGYLEPVRRAGCSEPGREHAYHPLQESEGHRLLLSSVDVAGNYPMSRANTIVCPGSKMPLAMQLIFTPMIWQLIDKQRKARLMKSYDFATPIQPTGGNGGFHGCAIKSEERGGLR